MKRCPTCKEVKPRGEFNKDASKKDGLSNLCKECNRAKSRKWRAENPEKERASTRKWYAENREKHRAIGRKWEAENREKYRARKRRWAAENPEKVRESSRKRVEDLRPHYVKQVLTDLGLPPVVIEENPELIELKRLHIQLTRKINQKKKEL